MKPTHLIETLKLTYHLDYAREVAGKMVKAAYPNATEEERPELMAMALQWFKLGAVQPCVQNWGMDDIEEFIQMYQGEFQKGYDTLTHYAMVAELLTSIAKRAAYLTAVTQVMPSSLPRWFRNYYTPKVMTSEEKA